MPFMRAAFAFSPIARISKPSLVRAMTTQATTTAATARGAPAVTNVPGQMLGSVELPGTLAVWFEAPCGQRPSIAQFANSIATKVIISEVMTSLALITALSTPGTRPQAAPPSIASTTTIGANSQCGRLEGNVSATPTVTKAPNHI